MLSTDDATVLQSIGHDVIHAFVAVTVETFAMAIYSVLVFKTSQLLHKKGTKVALYTWLAITAMYILALALWLIDVRNVVAELNLTLLSTSTDTLDSIYSAALSDILQLASYQTFLYAYMTIIGDGVIIWRVYAFWSSPRERFVLVVPCLFLLGSLSTAITITYCSARLGAGIELGTYQHPAVCRNIQMASYCTTLATTAVATALISYKAWQHRQAHLAAFGSSTRRTRVQKIMALLIESGVFYMLFFMVQVLMSQDSINISIEKSAGLTIAFTIYQYLLSFVVGIYPTFLVLLTHSKHSALDSTIGSVTVSRPIGVLSFQPYSSTSPSTLQTNTSQTKMQDMHEAELNLFEMSRMPSSSGSKEGDVFNMDDRT